MKLPHLISTMLMVLCISFTINAQTVVINELDADTDGTDVLEFIELKTTNPNQSLDGYILVFYNGNGDLSYKTIDLNGFSTNADGLFLLGNAGVSPTPSITWDQNTLQNGADAVGLYQASASAFPNGTAVTNTNLVDAIVYDTDDADDTVLISTLGVSRQVNEREEGNGTFHSIQRNDNGTYSVKTPTPLQSNDGSTSNTDFRVTISAPQTQYTEGANFDITFTSDVAVTEDIVLEFTLTLDDFTSADFTAPSQVTITNGSTAATITVNTIDDTNAESNEDLNVNCTTVPQNVLILNNNYKVKINDNDAVGSSWGTPLDPTYDSVSSTAPANYYATLKSLASQDLRDAIRDIIADPNVVRAQTYGDVWDIVKEADQDPSNELNIWMIYSETGRSKSLQQTGSTSTGRWNREHIYPQSRGGYSGGTSTSADGKDIYMTTSADHTQHGHSDAHALRPADFQENSIRSNKDFGEEYNGPAGNSGSWKGDVARAVFFMAIRYNELDVVSGDPSNSTVGQLGDLDSLIVWHRIDPPDDYEMNRNNVIYTWQRNRNPFIDLPDLAEYLWGNKVGEFWDSLVGINDLEVEEFNIYPNPATNNINLSFDVDGELIILDLNGRTITKEHLNGRQINISNLKSGIYYLRIITDDKAYVSRFVKH